MVRALWQPYCLPAEDAVQCLPSQAASSRLLQASNDISVQLRGVGRERGLLIGRLQPGGPLADADAAAAVEGEANRWAQSSLLIN